VDEAHAIGVLGEAGRGSVAAAGLDHTAVPLRLVTLGKALGSYGALVVGDADLVQHLAETARPYLYTTALPPALASAALAAVQRARQDEWRRERLVSLVAQFRAGAQHHGLPVLDSTTPIQLVPCGEDARALMLAQALEAQGFWVAAIRPPTVPEGRARLRITLSAAHTPADVARLLDALARAYATCGHAPIPHTDT
jgi:8-amino-7-oxononanoate synthase